VCRVCGFMGTVVFFKCSAGTLSVRLKTMRLKTMRLETMRLETMRLETTARFRTSALTKTHD
jgi:hypothetical protein